MVRRGAGGDTLQHRHEKRLVVTQLTAEVVAHEKQPPMAHLGEGLALVEHGARALHRSSCRIGPYRVISAHDFDVAGDDETVRSGWEADQSQRVHRRENPVGFLEAVLGFEGVAERNRIQSGGVCDQCARQVFRLPVIANRTVNVATGRALFGGLRRNDDGCCATCQQSADGRRQQPSRP